jgi:hypothetical protein
MIEMQILTRIYADDLAQEIADSLLGSEAIQFILQVNAHYAHTDFTKTLRDELNKVIEAGGE